MGVRAPAVVRVMVTVAQKLFVLALTLAILLRGSEPQKCLSLKNVTGVLKGNMIHLI